MLKTVELSRAKKTKGIAVTYRAGTGEKYGTCPTTCKMNCSGKGTEKIDADYLDALLDAKPVALSRSDRRPRGRRRNSG